MNYRQQYLSACLLGIAALLVGASPAWAQVSLGKASSFAVLAGTAVTCTTSTVNGDVGVWPGTAVTQTSCTINGTVHAGDGVAKQAFNDFLIAHDKYADIPCTGTLNTAYTNETLTLTPGVYCNTAGVTFTDTTLILQGGANAVWIFKIGTGGTGALTGTNFTVVMDGGGQACNVTWWVAEGATMTTSGFQGTILAGAAITVTGLAVAPTTTSFNGNALAKAAVTLTNVTVTGCTGGSSGGTAKPKCNQGVGNGPEKCDPGNSNQGRSPFEGSNDEFDKVLGTPGNPGKRGGNFK